MYVDYAYVCIYILYIHIYNMYIYIFKICIYIICIYIYDQAAWFAVGWKGIFLRAAKVVWSHCNIRQVLFALFLLNRPADTL